MEEDADFRPKWRVDRRRPTWFRSFNYRLNHGAQTTPAAHPDVAYTRQLPGKWHSASTEVFLPGLPSHPDSPWRSRWELLWDRTDPQENLKSPHQDCSESTREAANIRAPQR